MALVAVCIAAVMGRDSLPPLQMVSVFLLPMSHDVRAWKNKDSTKSAAK